MDTSVFILAILLVTYFFIIRPQFNQNKTEKKFKAELKRGDRIVTIGGIYGTVNDVNNKEGTCIIATMAGKIKIEISAISISKTTKLNKKK
ncbi:MAG: preprotein translocase subunit YajC [Flavobacteriaceae bacterium]|nr:preprotein translocase subunit YajC [Flavobacteriaceae bacterium]|tara:strand:+ start:315 stop:587 length:273 start_codon:yes stop_codon:yes gene_type:complete